MRVRWVVVAAVGGLSTLWLPAAARAAEPLGGPGRIVAALQVAGDDDLDVWVADADDSDAAQLTFSAGDEDGVTWSADGASIAFLAGAEIWVMDADGNDRRRISDGFEPRAVGELKWSPDGSMIALARTAGAGPESIWVFQADGSGFVEVATTAETRGFDWSPDSARIAYSDLTDPDTAVLYLVDADGTDRVPFNAEGRVEWPSWSPDGSRIAYGFLGLGLSDPQVEIVALDGSGGPTFSRAERAEWSPDGSRLILHALRGLLVVEAGGGGAHLPRALDGCDVQWGPDGARLLWACPEPGRTHVFTTFLDGRGAHDVAIADAEVADLDWQPLPCTVTGTDGNDVLVGHSSGDVICGLGGDDTLTGGRGDDVLIGGEGDDDLTGGQDNDWLVGNGGADHLSGGEGDDVVIGTDIGGADGGGGGPGLDFCPADPYDTLGNCET